MVPTKLDITRIIDAPPEKVFKVWTDANLVKEWWGPKHFTTPVCEIDPRVGGVFKFEMEDPQGNRYPADGEIKEIDEPTHIIFTLNALDTDGTYGIENLNTVTFEEVENQPGKTRLTVHVEVVRHKPEFEKNLSGMEQGWNQQLDKLADTFIS